MSERKRYRRKSGAEVTALRLDLETEGFSYFKWGARQQCKAGDWIVCNQGDVYTVSADTFAATYAEVSPGRYRKTGEVWAEVAETDGSVTTREGVTHYQAGDYLVCNVHDDTDCYAISRERFLELYEPVQCNRETTGCLMCLRTSAQGYQGKGIIIFAKQIIGVIPWIKFPSPQPPKGARE